MARFVSFRFSHAFRKCGRFFLAFVWLGGLVCGILLSLSAGQTYISWMRGMPLAPVSIVGLLLVSCLPFLCSALAVLFGKAILVLPVCFGKAVLFAFVSFGVLQSSASGGWLLRWLVMFTDVALMPVLYFFWLRCLVGDRRIRFGHIFLLVAVVFLIAVVDCSIVSPFLVGLID